MLGDVKRSRLLAESTDMEPVHGSIDLDIPANVLWRGFDQPRLWPRWNRCFFWCANEKLRGGDKLIWFFEPIRPWFLYKMPAIASIIELEEGRRVTWEVTALPGFYAHHTYSIDDLGRGRSRFASWEKAYGWGFRLTRGFWLRHFTFVRNRSLEGARALEILHLTGERIDTSSLPKRSYFNFWLGLAGLAIIIAGFFLIGWWGLLLLAVIVAAGVAIWFYDEYVKLRSVRLGPGVHAVLGGGGNTLVVEDGEDVLVVDTKFPPGSLLLRQWLRRNGIGPITKVINTHYHYDHSRGNVLFEGAEYIAHRLTRQAMNKVEGSWWARHRQVEPTFLIEGPGSAVRVGAQEVELFHLGHGHTVGDLLVHVPKAGVIATGDIIFNGYYCFLDLTPEGMSVIGAIDALRRLARDHPNAIFIPGHGPIARADDLFRQASYLEDLMQQVATARAAEASASAAVGQVDLTHWDLQILPSFHGNRLQWATAGSNVRSMFRLLELGR